MHSFHLDLRQNPEHKALLEGVSGALLKTLSKAQQNVAAWRSLDGLWMINKAAAVEQLKVPYFTSSALLHGPDYSIQKKYIEAIKLHTRPLCAQGRIPSLRAADWEWRIRQYADLAEEVLADLRYADIGFMRINTRELAAAIAHHAQQWVDLLLEAVQSQEDALLEVRSLSLPPFIQ